MKLFGAHNGGVIFLGEDCGWREGGREGEREEGGREGGRKGEREGGTHLNTYFDHTCAVLKNCNTIPIMTGMEMTPQPPQCRQHTTVTGSFQTLGFAKLLLGRPTNVHCWDSTL